MTVQEAIKSGAELIDVRTPMEFFSGSVAEAKNIPLNEIPERVEELKSMNVPLVLFCRSGARSEQARQYLSVQGISCVNGGPWTAVNNVMANLKRSK